MTAKMVTYQEFLTYDNKAQFIENAVTKHTTSDLYTTAKIADSYDRQQNKTINEYVQVIFSSMGEPITDYIASNNKIASNFFHRLNTQRCNYLLGNGVAFSKNKEDTVNDDGVKVTIDRTKEKLGLKFDAALKKTGYKALIHGVCFGFWNNDRLFSFPVTEFVPVWDEETGVLRAGVRFWQIDKDKPMTAVLYEEDGFTEYRKSKNSGYQITKQKKAYKTIVQTTEVGGDVVVGEENYSALPIVPFWGSSLKQSTLVGMRQAIDSYDLIRSGFANDLNDCAQIYWIVKNYGGMDDKDLERFRDKLRISHIVDVDGEGDVTPYTQDIPYQARKIFLDDIRKGLYEDFGGLDVHTVAAGATNDHIDAAYQPMDEEADDFEYQAAEFVQQILALIGIEDTPVFKRNRISNEMEQVQMLMLEANYLDDETILTKLPNITIDEVNNIMAKKDLEDYANIRAELGAETETETGEDVNA